MSYMLGHLSRPVLSVLTAQTQRQLQLSKSVRPFASLSSCVSSSPVFRPSLLVTAPVLSLPSAGIKHVAHVNKRCRHCYFQVKDEQLYVMCTANPKHYNAVKQKNKKWGNYVFTHATTGSTDGGYGRGSRHMKTQQSFRLDY